jgi:GNAT superfamily N-acetyltransferase
MGMLYRQITPEDAEYPGEQELRSAVLRRPLGLELSREDIQEDRARIHLVAIDAQERVVGCVLMAREGDTARIRQMAVAKGVQRQGVGRELMRQIEAIAIRMGCPRASMHARCGARGFYEKLGYKAV